MLSATLVPRMRDLIRRFAPQHIIIDLNKAMQAASDGSPESQSFGLSDSSFQLPTIFLPSAQGARRDCWSTFSRRVSSRVSKLLYFAEQDSALNA